MVQIKDGMKEGQKKGTFQLATCRLTSPNPPPSSFQLNFVFHCLRTTPNIPVLLLFLCETVSLWGSLLAINQKSWACGASEATKPH